MGVVLSLGALQFGPRAGERLYISARFNTMYTTGPSGQVLSNLVVHNVLLWTSVALVLKYFSVEACSSF